MLVEAVQLPDLAQEVAAMVPMDVTGDMEAPSVDTIVDVGQPLASILDAGQRAAPVVAVPPLANHQSTATRHDDDSIGSTRWA